MNEIIFITPDLSTELPLLYADGGIPAGFPSPAQDYVDGILDLNKELIQHPAATFYARVVGDSMYPGIKDGDLLVVDRSLEAFDDCIAVCCLNNEFTIKRVDLSKKIKDSSVSYLTIQSTNRLPLQKMTSSSSGV